MSYSRNRRLALDQQQPLPHRASHARSCALLVAQKWRVARSEVLALVRSETGIDLERPMDGQALRSAVECLDRLRFRTPPSGVTGMGPVTVMLPILSTDRLLLRPAAASDLPALLALWTDPEVRRYLWDDRVITSGEAAATLHDCHALEARGLGLWILVGTDSDDDILGCAGLFPVSAAAQFEPRLAGLVEPLVALMPRSWGRGYAREALQGLLQHANRTLGLPQLAGVTDVPNERSDRMLRSVGFERLSEVSGPANRLRTYLWRPESAPA